MISLNLQSCRFTKLKPLQKAPIGLGWQNKPYTYEEAIQFLGQGCGVGVLCGFDDIIAVDCDSTTLAEKLKEILPPTYQEITANKRLPRAIYKCKGWKTNLNLKTIDTQEHVGEILADRKQVVISPTKIKCDDGEIRQYKIINDIPITEITSEQLLNLIKCFKTTYETEKNVEKEKKSYNNTEVDEIRIDQVLSLSNFRKEGNGEYSGSCPWHGSTTGKNLWINPTKNVAYCFRCSVGISPMKAFALTENIIKNCDDSLKGEDFKKALERARFKGLIKTHPFENHITPIQTTDSDIKEKSVLELRTFRDFEKLKKDKNYLVKDFIPPASLTMWYSPPGMFKSITAQYMGMCVATGKPFLGLKTRKTPVLILDKENSDQINKERLTKIRYGLKVRSKDFYLYYLSRREGNIQHRGCFWL